MYPSEQKSWLRRLGPPLGFLAVLLGVIVSWEQIGLPRPAMSSEMKQIVVEQQVAGAYQTDTREMLLTDRLWLAKDRLARLGPARTQEAQDLKRRIELLERQLKDLRK